MDPILNSLIVSGIDGQSRRKAVGYLHLYIRQLLLSMISVFILILVDVVVMDDCSQDNCSFHLLEFVGLSKMVPGKLSFSRDSKRSIMLFDTFYHFGAIIVENILYYRLDFCT